MIVKYKIHADQMNHSNYTSVNMEFLDILKLKNSYMDHIIWYVFIKNRR